MDCVKLVVFMLYTFLCQLAFSSSSPHLCPKDQALALLQFKNMFALNPNASDYCYDISTDVDIQSYPRTLFWNKSTDCCSWDGVHCEKTTGQVIELDLRCSQLQGKFHSNGSLFQLFNLKRLDLSFNNFIGSLISPKFGEFSSLMHLDLSRSGFTGIIPSEICHLSKLHILRIGDPYGLSLVPHNFELLLKNLTQLRELNLESVNISSTIPSNFSSHLTNLQLSGAELHGILPERVFHLSNLESLHLSDNPQLTVRFPTTKWNSSASLMKLYVYSVNIADRIPESFSYLTALHKLDMGYNNLSGPIPKPLWNLTHIESLFLDYNHLEGPISHFTIFEKLKRLSLGNNNFDGGLEFLSLNRNWTQLKWLDFSSNSLTGPIPSNVSGLRNLQSLYLSSNHLNGTIPSWIFSLPSLTMLNMSDNTFTGIIQEFKSNTPNSFLNQQRLEILLLSNNNISGQIASTICNLKTLVALDLGSNNLEGTIPQCLSNLRILDLSNNSLSGTTDTTFSIGNSFRFISLHGNKLTGKVPPSLINCTYLEVLDLGNNQFNDTFPNWLGDLPYLQILSLRSNKLHGPIKSSGNNICNLKTLEVLDLRSNNLEGTIPHCMGEMSAVKILDLSNNGLSGTINTTFSIGNTFKIIKLDGNKLQGKVPPSLINCEKLEFLDLSNNELNDTFPKWLGDLPNLKILKLRSNKLYGPIRTDNFFAQIRVIDISSNGFSGELPVSLFQNFQAMKINDENNGTRKYVADLYSYYYKNYLIVTTKGLDHELPRVLTTQIIIDLSKNKFEGHIPSIIGDLIGLRTLNLSHNVLEGHIPASLQNLSVLESLDLSSNKLDGEIPQQLVSLTSLEVLNLSHNHLVGCIPKGKQFDTFENNSYLGNDGLRGLPPSRDCGRDDQATTPAELDQEEEEEEEEEEEDSPMISWQAVLMGYGCGLVIGLSVIYIMWSTQYPAWFSRMDVKLEHIITTRMKKHKKRYKIQRLSSSELLGMQIKAFLSFIVCNVSMKCFLSYE